MRTISSTLLCAAVTVLSAGVAPVGAPMALVSSAWAGTEKVLICHQPPDDPANRHTISVDSKAAESHFKNHPGDRAGECPSPCGDDAACQDGDACTIDDCVDGFCDNSRPVDCNDGNACTTDTCNSALGCVNRANEGQLCDDHSLCTSNDQCRSDGTCAGTAIAQCCLGDGACNDQDSCTVDSCTNNRCSNTPLDCSSGAPACTEGVCQGGTCVYAPVSCPDDGNTCTVEVCIKATNACESRRVREICDDGIDNDCDGSTDLDDPDCCPDLCENQLAQARASCSSDYDDCLSTCSVNDDCRCELRLLACGNRADLDYSACVGACGVRPT
jgi:hypothetical protein